LQKRDAGEVPEAEVRRVRRHLPGPRAPTDLGAQRTLACRVADNERRIDKKQRVVLRTLVDPVDRGGDADRPAGVEDVAVAVECSHPGLVGGLR